MDLIKIIESSDESDWLNMLKDRNLTSHTYQEKLSKEIFERIQKTYFPILEKTSKRLEKYKNQGA